MGIGVLVEHDVDGYCLAVDHPQVSGELTFRNQAVAQAVLNFLVEFNPYAFVPQPPREPSQWTPAEIAAQAGAEPYTPNTIKPLPAHVEALATLDADDAAPQMMDKAEAESR